MDKMWIMKKDVVEKDLSYLLVGIFFTIHKDLGRFARERQYCDALELELSKRGIPLGREHVVMVAGRPSNRVDFLVDGKIILEVKAKPFIEPEDYNQLKRYLHSAHVQLGIIINFREKYLHPRRVLRSPDV